MVKGFGRKHVKDGAANMADQQPAVIVSKASRPALFRQLNVLTSRLVFMLLIIAIAGYGGYLYWRHVTDRNRLGITHIPTAVEFQTAEAQKLKKNAPAVTASLTERLAYYDKLRKTEDLAGDYKAAISAFNTRLALSTDGLQFLDYYRLAQLNQAVGDKAAALKALDHAEMVIPADNPDSGYYRSDAVAAITRLRQVIQ